jgi:hypothetical protein
MSVASTAILSWTQGSNLACALAISINGPSGPPIIISNPTDQTVDFGNSVNFSVSASSQAGATLNYQWKENGTNIANATNVSVTINPTGTTDQNGAVNVSVWDTQGTTASASGIIRLNINGGFYAQESATTDHYQLEDASGAYLMESWSTSSPSVTFVPPYWYGDLNGLGRRFYSDRLN